MTNNKTYRNISRMWVNQPSTKGSYNEIHGVNVLACPEPDDEHVARIYFLSGKVESMRIPMSCLSPGWTGGLHK